MKRIIIEPTNQSITLRSVVSEYDIRFRPAWSIIQLICWRSNDQTRIIDYQSPRNDLVFNWIGQEDDVLQVAQCWRCPVCGTVLWPESKCGFTADWISDELIVHSLNRESLDHEFACLIIKSLFIETTLPSEVISSIYRAVEWPTSGSHFRVLQLYPPMLKLVPSESCHTQPVYGKHRAKITKPGNLSFKQ